MKPGCGLLASSSDFGGDSELMFDRMVSLSNIGQRQFESPP
jgi:hypothetical protein